MMMLAMADGWEYKKQVVAGRSRGWLGILALVEWAFHSVYYHHHHPQDSQSLWMNMVKLDS